MSSGGFIMSETDPAVHSLRGERDESEVRRSRSVQSRLGSVLAVGLMSVLGVGMLTWYYAGAITRPARARQSAQAASMSRVQGDMPLPSLGRIDPPATRPDLPPPDLRPADPSPDPLSPLSATNLHEIPLQVGPAPASYATPPAKSAEQLALERQLSGVVYAPQSLPARAAASASPPLRGDSKEATGELETLLRPSASAAVRAQILPTQRLLLPKGGFIDCTLETAIDSTLPGMTTCIMATDTFGVDGQVVLLERGTKLIGETRGQVQQGSARVFVLWTEARTPAGVIVPLASPGADELGRSGLAGTVDNHFWQRFGAAILVSTIDRIASEARRQGLGAPAIVVIGAIVAARDQLLPLAAAAAAQLVE